MNQNIKIENYDVKEVKITDKKYIINQLRIENF